MYKRQLSDPAVPTAALTVHAVLIGALRTALTSRLEELELWELYQQIELPLCSVLAEMEEEGVLVDRGALVQFGEMLSERIGQVQARIYDPVSYTHLDVYKRQRYLQRGAGRL